MTAHLAQHKPAFPKASPQAEWRPFHQTQDGTFGSHFAARKRDSQKCAALRPWGVGGKPPTPFEIKPGI